MTSNSIDVQVKPIASLTRGLEVLRLLEHEKSMSIVELMRESGLPRASLLRILKSLGLAGCVGRDAGNGRYYALPRGSAVDGATAAREQLTQRTAPHRAALEKQIPWPINMAVPDKFDMLILDTQSNCSLAPNYHALGYRPPMLVSAVGRVYLACCEPGARAQAIEAALHHGRLRKRINPDALHTELLKIKQAGYALYSTSHTAKNSPAGYGALAVPVFCGTQYVASLAMVWIPGLMNDLQVVHSYLGKLQQAAQAMSHTLTMA
jgi:IclR family transcriptional regulator, mhp operon transcriptional activator